MIKKKKKKKKKETDESLVHPLVSVLRFHVMLMVVEDFFQKLVVRILISLHFVGASFFKASLLF